MAMAMAAVAAQTLAVARTPVGGRTPTAGRTRTVGRTRAVDRPRAAGRTRAIDDRMLAAVPAHRLAVVLRTLDIAEWAPAADLGMAAL